MTIEAMKLMVAEMEYVLSCINEDKVPFDGDDFHEALRLGRQAIEQDKKELKATERQVEILTDELANAQRRIEQFEQAQKQERRCCPHDHDCAVHNMPAYPAGACDCTYKDTHNLPPSSVVHEICLALLRREVDRRCEDNFGRMPNDSWTNKVLDVYHFFDSNKKAKKLTVIYDTPPQRQPHPDCDNGCMYVCTEGFSKPYKCETKENSNE